jgi:uroporphyrinogen decarboxylase
VTPRDNLLRTLRREGFDNVPVDLSLCPSQEKKFRKLTGKSDYEEYFGVPLRKNWVPLKRQAAEWRSFYREELPLSTDFDDWGVAHSRGSDAAFHMTRMHHPLKGERTLREIEDYPLPGLDTARSEGMKDWVKKVRGNGLAAVGGMECTVWETAWYIRGMEDLMMDMLGEERGAEVLFDRITEIACCRARSYALAGCDILCLGDDIGTQRSPMMSVETWARWLKPRLAKVVRAAKEAKPDIIINYHSCGFVLPFLEGLIETGVEVLNPVQPESMDFEEVFRRTKGRLSYWGTVGTQTTLPFGKPGDVRSAVERILRICGEKGGVVIAPTHLVEPEVPWENIEAMVDAARKFKP